MLLNLLQFLRPGSPLLASLLQVLEFKTLDRQQKRRGVTQRVCSVGWWTCSTIAGVGELSVHVCDSMALSYTPPRQRTLC